MNTLSYAPLYFAVFALQTLAVATVGLARVGPSAGAVTLTLACGGAFAVALFCGYLASRRAYMPGKLAQIGQVALVVVLSIAWIRYFGVRGLWVVFALSLLFVRDLVLTTRRALYFDLAILLTVFYDAVGARELPFRWGIAIAFLLGLVFLLIADYVDRRLAQLKIGDARALTAIIPGLRNAAFATALVLAVAAVIYVLMPQPRALDLGVFPEKGPPGSLSELLGGGRPLEKEPEEKGEPSAGGTGERPLSGAASGGEKLDLAGGAAGGSGSKSGDKTKSPAQSKKSKEKAKGGGAATHSMVLFMQADRPLYLRTHAYAFALRDGWYEAPFARIDTPGHVLIRKGAPRDGVTQRLKITRDLGPRVPAAHAMRLVEHKTTRAYRVNVDTVIDAETPLKVEDELHVISNVRYLGERASGPDEDTPPRTHTHTSLPLLVAERVRKLASDVAVGRTVPSERAAALEQYLRANYKPAPFTPRDGIDPTLQFLFEDRGGSSRQFAGALAVMLRSIGIPSRIVAGYRARRLNPIHEHYEVWTSDRHHWVEAYIERGWVAYDPSPWGVLPAKQMAETWFQAAREYVRYAREDPVDVLLAGEEPPRVSEWYLWAVLVYGWCATFGKLLLLALIAFTAAAWKWQSWSLPFRDALDRWRLRHASQGDPVGLVRRCYEAVERMAARRSLARARSENHAEYLERLARERPHLDLPCRTLAAHFGVARYGRDLSSSQAQDALQAARVIADLIDERRVA